MWKEKKEDRFEKTYSQGWGAIEIWVDKETGIEYLHCMGTTAGFMPLLDVDGKPKIDPNYRKTI